MTILTKEQKAEISAIAEGIFIAGQLHGETDLEEQMDNNLFDSFLIANCSRRTGDCRNVVAKGCEGSRPVRYNLRSNEWRDGARKTARNTKKEFVELIFNALER